MRMHNPQQTQFWRENHCYALVATLASVLSDEIYYFFATKKCAFTFRDYFGKTSLADWFVYSRQQTVNVFRQHWHLAGPDFKVMSTRILALQSRTTG